MSTAATAGDLASAHVGAVVTIEVTESMRDLDGSVSTSTRTVTGDVVRVQHNPGVTLLALSSWSGELDPTHPITIETGA